MFDYLEYKKENGTTSHLNMPNHVPGNMINLIVIILHNI